MKIIFPSLNHDNHGSTNNRTTRGSFLELNLDQSSILFLGESARWARFLSIIGFISCGLMVIVGLFFGSLMGGLMSSMGGAEGRDLGMLGSGFFGFIYILGSLLIFFPALFLYRFSIKMRRAITNNEQPILTDSFKNLKSFFKFYGIVTIVILAFYLLAIIGGIISALLIHRA